LRRPASRLLCSRNRARYISTLLPPRSPHQAPRMPCLPKLLKSNRFDWPKCARRKQRCRRLRLLTSLHCLKTDGGAGRDRTDDLLLAKQALSQLSYSPAVAACGSPTPDPRFPFLVGLDGFEPSTPALSRRCSNQLSYRPNVRFGCLDSQPIGVGAGQRREESARCRASAIAGLASL
jgi:hypothetical protein